MILLGALLLSQAVADSRIGDWLLARPSTSSGAPLSGVDRVFISSDGVEAHIQVEDRADLSASLTGAGARRASLRVDRRGSEVHVSAARPWWSSPFQPGQTILEVRLPAAYAGALGVQVRSGSLSLVGPAADAALADPSGPSGGLASLELELRSGRVDVSEIRTEALMLVIRSGWLAARGLTAERATLHQASGTVRLARYAGPLEAHLASGDLTVQFASLPGPVRVDQASGRLSLDLPDDAGFELDVEMRSGRFRSDLPSVPAAGDVRSGLRVTQGPGGPQVRLRANSGTITLQ